MLKFNSEEKNNLICVNDININELKSNIINSTNEYISKIYPNKTYIENYNWLVKLFKYSWDNLINFIDIVEKLKYISTSNDTLIDFFNKSNLDKDAKNSKIIDIGKIITSLYGELHIGNLLNKINDICYIDREPEGSGKHPDYLIKTNDNKSIYIEAKCIKKQDDEALNINNATNSEYMVRQYINEYKTLGYDNFINYGSRESKIFFDTITIFLYYKIDADKKLIIFYDYDIIPLPVAILFELNKDGYLVYNNDNDLQLTKKSNGNTINQNVCLNLKFIKDFNNNYNFLSDPLLLYLTGKTHLNKNHIISDTEVKYINFLTYINESDINNIKINYELVKKIYSSLKTKNTTLFDLKNILSLYKNYKLKYYNIIKKEHYNTLYNLFVNKINEYKSAKNKLIYEEIKKLYTRLKNNMYISDECKLLYNDIKQFKKHNKS